MHPEAQGGAVDAAPFSFRSSREAAVAEAAVVVAAAAVVAVDSAGTSCRSARWSRRELTWFV